MQWITEQQADNFLGDNPEWEAFTNKNDLLKLATNRLEQLTFKEEDKDRVGFRYIDGNSVSKVAGSDDFLLEAEAGNFAYHEALGWTKSNEAVDLFIYTLDDVPEVVFIVPDNDATIYLVENQLTFKQIQSLHTFGGTFTGTLALDIDDGEKGCGMSIETEQANGIVGADGEQVFLTHEARRIIAPFAHNGVNVELRSIGGTIGTILDGVATVDVIDEQGNPQTITTPNIVAGEIFTYSVKVINGLNQRMYLYMNGGTLIANPTFAQNEGGTEGNRLLYTSGSAGGIERVSYIRKFGAVINTENPITIPIRLVGACALLALEYGKFPPNFVGDKEYLENENDYASMQDLPINVQAAVEPFLADYIVPVVLDERGEIPKEVRKDEASKAKTLEYS